MDKEKGSVVYSTTSLVTDTYHPTIREGEEVRKCLNVIMIGVGEVVCSVSP
jgi:hypothetical protein